MTGASVTFEPGARTAWQTHPLSIADQSEPPSRWLAGADAISEGERKMCDFKAHIEANRELSSSLAHEEA